MVYDASVCYCFHSFIIRCQVDCRIMPSNLNSDLIQVAHNNPFASSLLTLEVVIVRREFNIIIGGSGCSIWPKIPRPLRLSLFATPLKVYLLANGSLSMARHDVHVQTCKQSHGDCLPEFYVNLMSLSLGCSAILIYWWYSIFQSTRAKCQRQNCPVWK